MLRFFATQLCLAFGTGLMASWVLGLPAASGRVALVAGFLAIAGGMAAWLLPRRWLAGPDARQWVALGLVAALAVGYLQLRVPRPAATDISQLIVGNAGSEQAKVWGTVQTLPSLTASNKLRFWLNVDRTQSDRAVTGKLYVTAPLLQGTGVYPGQAIAVAGRLYKPSAPRNPGAFSFRDYLARQGAFAGFSAENIELQDAQPQPGWWQLRRRIVKALVRGLGSPSGQLVGSIALGRRAVDLPPDVRELFIRAGLAHILAASGFHVSLLLGSVAAIAKALQPRGRLASGLGALALYVGLTGISPSVARAAIMGGAGLIAQQRDRKVNPVGALLLAATGLLFVNPLWIADLGFQLSFLATLGLLVTVPTVSKWFAWLPEAISGTVAVPIAVLPWVLPLQLWTFGVFPPYSILVNILTVPLVIVVSLGGMFSALVAAIFPPAGSAVAWLLFYPVQALLAIVAWCDRLPGSSFAIGRIAWWQLVLLYGAIFTVWGWGRLRRWWGIVVLVGIAIVIGPLAQQRLTSSEVTLLAAGREPPILVARDRNATLLINSGDAATARYVVVPFLQQTGIARLEAALATSKWPQMGWPTVAKGTAIARLYQHPEIEPGRSTTTQRVSTAPLTDELTIGEMQVGLEASDPSLLELTLRDRRWSILGRFQRGAELPVPEAGDRVVLVWSGQRLPTAWLEKVAPETAIATGSSINDTTADELQAQGAQVYALGRDGAVSWQQRGRGPWRLQVGAERQAIAE